MAITPIAMVRFEEQQHACSGDPRSRSSSSQNGQIRQSRQPRLFTLLKFSPCEGFLPADLSGITYGWIGFVVLSAVLAVATIAGMVGFTWLTMARMEPMHLGFLERSESVIFAALILFLGVGIIFFGF
ncbi:hypothetical protein GGQ99_005232 [Aminobacter niigataensis]|uniref:Uncharacterized protein n=1 Tax=Aminobacter niigataensis TaxID=83265 RepID=A0ABR6L9E3_9HYPH|nr:hypothetical protein [Aminobacter niigataensis]MBB4653441.1 hypothetical protein [Aminobacter niigataensis]